MKIVIIVSADVSDLYFANQLLKQLNVTGVVIENQSMSVTNKDRWIKYKSLLTNPFFLTGELVKSISRRMNKNLHRNAIQADHVNHKEFGDEGYKLFPAEKCRVIYTEGINKINDPLYIEQIRTLAPDVIAVCGASILKQELIQLPKYGVLNLHGGLSQRYRGLWTTDWALHNEEPEYIGATVHYVSEGIDDGDILMQGRPEIDSGDNPKTLYAKVVKLGIKMMVMVIKNIDNGETSSYPLLRKGKLYYSNMATDKMRKKAWDNSRNKIIQSYLDNKTERDKPVLTMMQGNILDNSPDNSI